MTSIEYVAGLLTKGGLEFAPRIAKKYRERQFRRRFALRTQTIRLRRQGGQALIMITLALVPMFGIMGMVTDLGYMHYMKMKAQTAAELAAKAAAINLHATAGGTLTSCSSTVVCASTITQCPTNITTPQNSIEVGCMYAAQHGFQATGNQNVTYQTGGSSLTGTSATPPTVSGIPNVSYWVTFRVVQQVPQMFSAVLGFPNGVVAARSTAVVTGASDCIYVMDPAASGAMNVNGTAELQSSCGLYVNSSSGTALTCNGHGSSYAYDAPEYDVVGGYSCPGTAMADATPNTGVSHISDPLAGLPVPATAPYTCNQTNFQVNAGSASTVVPLSPGVYCGGISVKKGIAQFGTGQYILVGGGLSTQNTNSTIDASAGVLIYNTSGTVGGTTYAYGPISIVANSNANMKAMTSGTYAGILYFEDRNAPTGQIDTFSGGSNSTYTGTLYAINSEIDLYGNPSLTSAAYTMIVADKFNLTGASYVNNDYSSLPGGNPLTQVALVE
jgi:Flp pilus assembly protein TadG